MGRSADILNWLPWGIPLGIFVASLMGSLHCVSMCGGLVANVAPTRKEIIQYHLARLVGYLVLGALAGLLGQSVILQTWTGPVGIIFTLMTSLLMIWAGIRAWGGMSIHLPLPQRWQTMIYGAVARASAPGVGLMSALLPCGWLYTFLLAAIASGSPARGGATLFAFWLGTVPALSALPWMIRMPRISPKISAVVLVCAALFNIGFKWNGVRMSSHSSNTPLECHHH